MVRSIAEIVKPRILKNERKKDITLILLVLQEGFIVRGWSGSIVEHQRKALDIWYDLNIIEREIKWVMSKTGCVWPDSPV